uniref:Uncharacterized protein n=1 Tax=Meloidogyne javanica TaxID=6303 RepID=A0A915MGZ2_MELJA
VKYLPMDLMKKARECEANFEMNQCIEKLWGGFACCVKRYFAKNFFIDVKSRCAIIVLSKILMECSRGLLDEYLLIMAEDKYITDLDEISFCIEKVEEFIQIVEKIDPNEVEQKLGNYKMEKHDGAIFSYDFKFKYTASKLKEEDYKELETLKYERVYLRAIPKASQYEKSFMHRDTITHVLATEEYFIVTASQDGHLKFWKKKHNEGIEFVKHFRCSDLVNALAVSDARSGNIIIVDSNGNNEPIYLLDKLHQRPVILMQTKEDEPNTELLLSARVRPQLLSVGDSEPRADDF